MLYFEKKQKSVELKEKHSDDKPRCLFVGKLRKRYLCEDIATSKKYLFSPVARVKKIKHEKSSS